MATPVVTVASGGLPVVDVTASTPKLGMPVTEALNGRGTPVTKVAARGMPVTYSTVVDYPPSGGGGTTYATWDVATITAVTLSGGSLAATNTGTTSTDQGAHVAAASGKTSGKYYFEVTWTAITGGGNFGVGVGTTASTYTGMGNTGGVTGVHMYVSSSVWSNGGALTTLGGVWLAGQVAGIALDLDNRKIWFRQSPSGIWNNNAASDPTNPAAGTLFTVPAGTMVPFVTFGGSGGAANNVLTANFGTTAFSGAVPAGYTPGWTP